MLVLYWWCWFGVVLLIKTVRNQWWKCQPEYNKQKLFIDFLFISYSKILKNSMVIRPLPKDRRSISFPNHFSIMICSYNHHKRSEQGSKKRNSGVRRIFHFNCFCQLSPMRTELEKLGKKRNEFSMNSAMGTQVEKRIWGKWRKMMSLRTALSEKLKINI